MGKTGWHGIGVKDGTGEERKGVLADCAGVSGFSTSYLCLLLSHGHGALLLYLNVR